MRTGQPIRLAATALAGPLILGGCASPQSRRPLPSGHAPSLAPWVASSGDLATWPELWTRSDASLGAFREPLRAPGEAYLETRQHLRISDGRPHEHSWWRLYERTGLGPGW